MKSSVRVTDGAVQIAGAGPAGLAAAITIAKAGRAAHVFERRAVVGARFHGDFQGLENWSTETDVLEELEAAGIAPTFEHTAFREFTMFDGEGRSYVCRSEKPLWYLVRRGRDLGTLDRSLEQQAIECGATIECSHALDRLPDGGIVAHGPRRADVIASGFVFETDAADGAYAAVSDSLAPGGYAYLLVCGGRGTIATCLFDDFHNERRYLTQTVDFFDRHVGIKMQAARHFGGFGNLAWDAPLQRGRLLFAGEAAGLQDALFGFGMRYAMMSGHLAGRAFAEDMPERYAIACRKQLLPFVRTAFVNRALYSRGGDRGYQRLIAHLSRLPDSRPWLRRYYTGRWWTPLLYPLAQWDVRRRHQQSLGHACRDDCVCTWCRCQQEDAGAAV